jgi:hypothetical protein
MGYRGPHASPSSAILRSGRSAGLETAGTSKIALRFEIGRLASTPARQARCRRTVSRFGTQQSSQKAAMRLESREGRHPIPSKSRHRESLHFHHSHGAKILVPQRGGFAARRVLFIFKWGPAHPPPARASPEGLRSPDIPGTMRTHTHSFSALPRRRTAPRRRRPGRAPRLHARARARSTRSTRSPLPPQRLRPAGRTVRRQSRRAPPAAATIAAQQLPSTTTLSR